MYWNMILITVENALVLKLLHAWVSHLAGLLVANYTLLVPES